MRNDEFLESAGNEAVSRDAASDATIQGVHDPAIVEKILEMDALGLSGRKIAEEIGGEELSKDDIFAVLRHFKVWTAWKCPDTENRVGRAVGQTGDPEDGEKVAELVRKIEQLESEKDRILTEKVARERDLKLLNENTKQLREWVARFKPELDGRIEKLTEECATLTFRNKELEDQISGKPSPLLDAASGYQSAYARGREAGREEIKLEAEGQGTSWLTYLLIPLTGIAGILSGALLVWVLS